MRKVRVAAAILLLATGGCERDSGGEESPDADRFGSGYEIVTNEEPALPDEPPALINDTLFAHITYPGGCTDHDFELETEVRRDTARLWLHHDAHGDDCEGIIRDRLDVRVPEDVLISRTILLMNPNETEPFVLRWGELPARRDSAVVSNDSG